MRVRGFPFGDEVRQFLEAHDVNFVVEQNRDAQLRSLLTLETGVADREARVGALLRRLPAERASRDRRRQGQAGARRRMTSIAKPTVAPPGAAEERARPHAARLRGRDVDAVRRLRPRLGHRRDRPGVLGARRSRRTRVAKLSGIGCSSKTPAYFLREAHGFNSVHGRMPAIATGANAANRELIYIGISGDGDSLSIGLGQLCHAIRRNVNMLYVLENNGVYGLTKGQFSASADIGLDEQEGRGEHAWRRSTGAAGADARRHLRRAQLLGRQGRSWCRSSRPG